MSLLRAFLAFWCVIVPLQARGLDDDWVRERQARDGEAFVQCLRDLEEKPLEPAAQDRSIEIYRMVYLPSFYPQVSMRVNVWPTGDGRLTMRSIRGYCGRNTAVTIEQRQVDLSGADVVALRDVYARADFWRRVKIEDGSGADGIEAVICSDGASVYFEAVREGRHHRVSRTCVWIDAIEDIKVVFHRLARVKDPHRTD